MRAEIIIYSFFPWEHHYPSTAHGLSRALARDTRVWFVSKPPTWKDVLAGNGAEKFSRTRVERLQLEDGGELMLVTLPATPPINAFAPGALYEAARGWTDAGLNAALRGLLRAHGVGDFWWINVYAPTQFVDLRLHRKPLRRIYYSVDAIEVNPYTRKHGVLAEAVQVERADLVLCTSRALARKHHVRLGSSTEAGTRIEVVPNAVAADLYLDVARVAEPEDLTGIPHPRLGFVGNLDPDRLDYDGLYALALSRPQYHLVLIGPWNAGGVWRERFATLPNVHLLGTKPQAACPAYLQHVDLGLIPFALNALTAAIYPLKINEYLALGLPVVASTFSEDMKEFGDLIALAPAAEWPAAVDAALGTQSEEEVAARIERARENDWAARARRVLELVGARPVPKPQPA